MSTSHTINNVPGTLLVTGSGPRKSQIWESVRRTVTGYGAGASIVVVIQLDDSLGSGHGTFSMTATITGKGGRFLAGGCLHDDITERFPELAPLIKWHLCSTDGPMHYIAKTLHHVSDRDSNGLRKGEVAPVCVRGEYQWELDAPRSIFSKGEPPAPVWHKRMRTGEGKEINLEAARSCAVWPDATDEQLMVPADELRAVLEARLPGLIVEFKQTIESIGLVFDTTTD